MDLMLLAQEAVQDTGMIGLGIGLSAVGAGLAVIGAALGIGRAADSAAQSVARQPEMAGDIRNNTLIFAALIEGVALFAVVVAFLSYSGMLGKM